MNRELYNDASWLIAAVMRELIAMPEDTPGAADVLTRISEQDLSEKNFDPAAPARLPGCRHLSEAVAAGLIVSTDVCAAIAAIEDQLHWTQSAHYSDELFGQPGYMNNYAFAEVIGTKGFFRGDDLRMGLMVFGPGLHYIDHYHATPELYWLLTGPIEYRRAPGDFQSVSTASTIWNEPNEVHAIKTGTKPLLAIWICTKDVDQLPVLA